VVLNWRAVCGDCRACDRGEPWYCFATHNATQKMTLAEGDLAGTELSPRWASARSRRRRWSPRASARRSTRPRGLLRWGCWAAA
jgi:hypothetical protein